MSIMAEEKNKDDFTVNNLVILGNGKWGSRVYDLLTNPKRQGGKEPPYSAKILGPEMNGEKIVLDPDGRAAWSNDARKALSEADVIFAAIPLKNYRDTLNSLKSSINPNAYMINGSKGCEYDPKTKTVYLPYEIIRQELPSERNRNWVASLCGPNIQHELGIEPYMVAAAEIGCWIDPDNFIKDWKQKQKYLDFLSDLFDADKYNVVNTPNLLGVELGAALKNIFAMGSGIIDGYYGIDDVQNTRGTLLAMADYDIEFIYEELSKEKIGWKVKVPPLTLGDLIATSFSKKSRNHQFGRIRGKEFREKGKNAEYKTADQICNEIQQAVEGINTIENIIKLSEAKGWTDKSFEKDRIPIIRAIYEMVHGTSHVEDVLDKLHKLRKPLSRRNAFLYMQDIRKYKNIKQ